jgi:hypothetical protein
MNWIELLRIKSVVSLLANTAKCEAKIEPVFLVCIDDEEEVT